MDAPLEKLSALRRENINISQYTISLLNEAVACSLLSGTKLEEIQLQIMQVLQERMTRYTAGESSSVSAETAQSLLSGVLYCVDTALLERPSPEAALAFVIDTSLSEIYESGLALVKQTVKQTKEQLQDLQKNSLSIELEAYQSTVNYALSDFFAAYDPEFFPHEAAGLIDYPLLFDDSGRTTVFYIRDYIGELQTETSFCRCFTEQAITELLSSYGSTYCTDYRVLLINISEVVINNCVFSVLAGHHPGALFVTQGECTALTRKWRSYNEGQLELLLRTAAEQIIRQLNIGDEALITLLRRYPPVLAPRVFSAVQTNTLNRLAIVRYEAEKPIVQFQEGEKLTDKALRGAAKRILACTSGEDKVKLIHTEIHSFEDLLDILSSECLFGAEYDVLFGSFGDAELSLLCLNMLEGELYAADMDSLSSHLFEMKPEKEWQRRFLSYLALMDAGKLAAILRCAKIFSDSME